MHAFKPCLHFFLIAGRPLVAGKTVLELGSGTGAVGLVAAALGASKVALTDLPALLPVMEANINNPSNAAHLKREVKAMPLDWNEGAEQEGISHSLQQVLDWLGEGSAAGACVPDVVLASDVAYLADQLAPLFGLIAKIFKRCAQHSTTSEAGTGQAEAGSQEGRTAATKAPSQPLVLLSYEEREPIQEQFLQELLAAGLWGREVGHHAPQNQDGPAVVMTCILHLQQKDACSVTPSTPACSCPPPNFILTGQAQTSTSCALCQSQGSAALPGM
jgi:hypothetical protein